MLAVASKVGQIHDSRGRKLLEDFANKQGWEIQQGPVDQPAPVDGIFTQNGYILAVVEARTRVTHSRLDIKRLGDTYLISALKLSEMMETGRLLGVPSLLVVQFACQTRWVWKIGDEEGQPLFRWTERDLTNDASQIDSRQLTRLTGYLPMKDGRQWT